MRIFSSTRSWIRLLSYGREKMLRTRSSSFIVDLRSDTVTKPTPAMRKAMESADVGDDMRNEDPTVNELERRCAELFGVDAALFVPSGTMGNLISIMVHCNERGGEMIVGSNHHVHLYEQGCYAQVAGVASHQIVPDENGLMDLAQIEASVRPDDQHYTQTRLVCLENTHLHSGGRQIPVEYHKAVWDLTRKYGIKVHLDGARLMNACVALNVSPKEIVRYVDSVSMCFSKGLGCPIGSIIGGNLEFIRCARRARKALGGAMRQVGVLAAAALHVLDTPYEEMLRRDHRNAKRLAQGISNLQSEFLRVNVDRVQTNFVLVNTGTISAEKVCELLERSDNSKTSVLTGLLGPDVLRLAIHRDITDDGLDRAIEKFEAISHQLPSMVQVLNNNTYCD